MRYHLPLLHQKLTVNLCCDSNLDFIPVLLPTFAVTEVTSLICFTLESHQDFHTTAQSMTDPQEHLTPVLQPTVLDDRSTATPSLFAV